MPWESETLENETLEGVAEQISLGPDTQKILELAANLEKFRGTMPFGHGQSKGSKLDGLEQSLNVDPVGTNRYLSIIYTLVLITFGLYFG
jgi:hypothetical protein